MRNYRKLWGINMWPFKRKIKSVESIMAPLAKTRNKLEASQEQNNEAITNNIARIEALKLANKAHAAEANLASIMKEGIDSQLKPLDDLKKLAESIE